MKKRRAYATLRELIRTLEECGFQCVCYKGTSQFGSDRYYVRNDKKSAIFIMPPLNLNDAIVIPVIESVERFLDVDLSVLKPDFDGQVGYYYTPGDT